MDCAYGRDQYPIAREDFGVQPPQPGEGGHQKQVVRQRVEPSAPWCCCAEAAREVAVQEVGRAGQQQTEADHPAVSGQRWDRQDRNQKDPGAREKVGYAP